jgi:putative restriction endonuclease
MQEVRANESALVHDLNGIDQQQNVDPTTKKALVDARLGQGKFRTEVLQSWGNCCSVTRSTIQAAIRASHIKPWSESNNAERLDPNNGLALIASLDALFDAGLISFDSSGKLIVSANVNTTERDIFGIGEASLTKKPTAKMVDYLTQHRAKHGFIS